MSLEKQIKGFFTDHKDKRGVPIRMGDYLKTPDEEIVILRFDDRQLSAYIANNDGTYNPKYRGRINSPDSSYLSKCEVVNLKQLARTGPALMAQDIKEYLNTHAQWFNSPSLGEQLRFFAANLSGIVLRGAFLKASFLEYCNFDGADLRGCDFSWSELNYCSFVNADIREANFNGSAINHADFTGANTNGCNFSGVYDTGTKY